MKQLTRAACATCLMIAVSACGSHDQDEPGDTTVEALPNAPAVDTEKTVNGALLAEVDLGGDHRVEFYEYAHGQAGVYETLPMDAGEPLLREGEAPGSLSEVYRKVVGESAEVPVALQESDARSARLLAETADLADPGTATPMVEDPGARLEQGDMIAKACSPDQLGDNFGAQWFLNNHCTQGAFRRCDTNRATIGFGNVVSSFLSFGVMAADFAVGARMNGGHWAPRGTPPCARCIVFFPDFDFPVQPRFIGNFTYVTSGNRNVNGIGNGACQRIHYSLGSNQPI